MNSIKTIDQMGEFVEDHAKASGRPRFGGPAVTATVDRDAIAAALLPHLRGAVSSNRRVIAHFDRSDDALEFANSRWGAELSQMGTSCPDHFLRTRICPMFVPWDPAGEDVARLQQRIAEYVGRYRDEYVAYYTSCAQPDSPSLRDSNPSVVVIPALGVFGFGKDKREARITTEFFVNAVHVMAGATALEESERHASARCRRRDGRSRRRRSPAFTTTSRCREAKRSASNTGRSRKRSCSGCRRSASSAGRSRSSSAAAAGSAGRSRSSSPGAARTSSWPTRTPPMRKRPGRRRGSRHRRKWGMVASLDLSSRETIASALRHAILAFGGVDIVINTAAIYPTPDPSVADAESVWTKTLQINVTGNYVLAQEAARVLKAQNLPAAMVLHQFGQRRRAQERERGVRCQQGRGQSPDSRAGDRSRPARAGQRHCAGDGDCRIVDVPARSRHRRPAEVQHRLRGRRADRGAAGPGWRSSTRSAPSPAVRSCRRIAPTRSAGWPATRARRPPATSFPVDGGLPDAFLR